MKRPMGVTILAVLAIVGGIVNIVLALPYLGVTALALPGVVASIGSLGTGVLMSLGVGMLLIGAIQLMFGIGAMQLRSWAWVMGVIGYGLSVLSAIVSVATVGFTSSVMLSGVIAVAILAYLFTHDVRTAFDHEDGSLFHSSHHTPMGAA
jgi:hypothetical protein